MHAGSQSTREPDMPAAAIPAPTLPDALHERLAQAFPSGAPNYDSGYRDALESVALTLAAAGVPQSLLDDAITAALDAFTNNVC
jgi:hypothetical protein